MCAVCINVNGIEKVKQRNSENVTEKIGISSASVHESVCCIVFSIYSDRFELNVPNPARIVKCVHIENSENTKGSHITPPKRCPLTQHQHISLNLSVIVIIHSYQYFCDSPPRTSYIIITPKYLLNIKFMNKKN